MAAIRSPPPNDRSVSSEVKAIWGGGIPRDTAHNLPERKDERAHEEEEPRTNFRRAANAIPRYSRVGDAARITRSILSSRAGRTTPTS